MKKVSGRSYIQFILLNCYYILSVCMTFIQEVIFFKKSFTIFNKSLLKIINIFLYFFPEKPWILYGIIIALSSTNLISMAYWSFRLGKKIKQKVTAWNARREVRQNTNPIALRQLQRNIESQDPSVIVLP